MNLGGVKVPKYLKLSGLMLNYAVDRNAQTSASTAISASKPEARNSAGLAGFPPEYFALVMATGIVSLAVHDQGWKYAAQALFWLNLAAYFTLWILTVKGNKRLRLNRR